MTVNLDAALDGVIGAARTPAAPSAWQPTGQRLAEVPVTALLPDPENPREDVGDVTDLAASMKAAGLLQPIIARVRSADGRLVVVAGHRRLAACQQLGWKTVHVVIRRDMRPDDVLAAMLIENGQRAGLDPIEEARAIAKLRGNGRTDKDVGRMIGLSNFTVYKRLTLLSLPPQEQEALRAGTITLREAQEKAVLARGTVRPKKKGAALSRGWHFDHTHSLASRAKARCNRLKHMAGRRVSGGQACGECWESVIRADEREQLHGHAAASGRCPLCDHPTS